MGGGGLGYGDTIEFNIFFCFGNCESFLLLLSNTQIWIQIYKYFKSYLPLNSTYLFTQNTLIFSHAIYFMYMVYHFLIAG